MLRQIRIGMLLGLSVWAPIRTTPAPQSAEGKKLNASEPVPCPVTIGRKALLPPSDAIKFFGAGAAHWNGSLFVGGLWPDGTIVFRPRGAGIILPDGSLSMKFGWWRGAGLRGKLTIYGKRLDAAAPPLRARIPDGYGDTGFQATGVIFPTQGCWEVTGEVGDAHVTFVTRVVKLEERN